MFTRRIFSAFAILVFAAGLLAGCDSGFEAINSNPNEPEEVAPGLLLPNIIRDPVNTSVWTAHDTGNLILQHTAKVQFAGSIDRYNWDFEGYWDALYSDLRNVQDMLDVSRAAGQENYEGVALVMKSWIFSLLTDAYGDVPYQDALKAKSDEEYTPAFTPQEEIYEGLLADLERAAQLLDASGESIQGDILYGGDAGKWEKFANALRLRLLMRLSDRQDVAARLQEIVGNPGQYPVFESNADNAALTYLSSVPNTWPVHTSRLGSFRTYRMSKTLTDTLQALDDPRLTVYADPTEASVEAGEPVYVGVPNGLFDDESTNYNGGPSHQSTLNRSKYYERPDAAEGLIMTYSEVLFLQAEAAERGWIDADAEALYEAGIRAAFEQYGLELPAGYFEQPAVAYAADHERALEQIGTQKWIALFYTGLEAWFDWRRTGYPDIDPAVRNQNGDRIPVRFRYPSDVQSLNAESYQEAVSRQGPDNINTEMWLVE